MSVVEVLVRLGGVATWSALTRTCSPTNVARGVAAGDIVMDARGRYALPGADEALRAANRLSAVLSHRSAAQYHGWAQKRPPSVPELVVTRSRVLTRAQTAGVVVHRADLPAEDVDGQATSRRRTLADCLRALPEDEAWAIADSALRDDSESSQSLRALASSLRGPGRRQAVRVAAAASGLSANPFETELRRLALDAGLDVQPQVSLYGSHFLGRPDLVDVHRRVILEADSFEWHGSRRALADDARRYNGFVVAGWLVLRFSWEDVMLHPDYVLGILRQVVSQGSTKRADRDRGYA